METKNKPEKEFKIGAVKAAVWKNVVETPQGEKSYHTVSFDRSYKDKSGNWKTTNSLRTQDLPKATLILSKAYEYLSFKDQTEDAPMQG